jgi:hypothetical protein
MAIGFIDTRPYGDIQAFSARLPSQGRLGA